MLLLLADSIYQEGVEGDRARGRANLPSLQWRLWSMVKLFTLFDMHGFYFVPLTLKTFLLHISSNNVHYNFFLQKETPQVWLDEIWVDN